MKKVYTLSLFLIITVVAWSVDYSILNYGAEQNHLSTSAIQKAIDDANVNGGGKVIIPAGRFITGTLNLKSNVILYLKPGSVLEGSLNLDDYTSTFRTHGMVFCENAENVGITGYGEINAMGINFYDPTQNHVYDEFDKAYTRQKEGYMPEGEFYEDGPIKRLPKPGMTISFFHCSNIKLSGIRIIDTPSWAVRFGYCDDVLVEGISIYNNLMIPNSDGIHCTASRNIRMSDCDIRAGDDAFIVTGFTKEEESPGFMLEEQLKYNYGNMTQYAENVTVSNCHLQSRSAGIRIGYGQHPIRNCTFNNITIYGSNRGIGIFAHDEADIENLIFSDITIQTRLHSGQWWGNAEPIHLSCISRFENEPAGQIKNVYFSNIIAESEHGILIYGTDDAHPENIHLENVNLKIIKGKETLAYGGNIDLRPAADPEKRLFEHDIPGILAYNTDGLYINNFRLSWGSGLPKFFTHGIWCENVKGLEINDFHGQGNPSSPGSKRIMLNKTSFRTLE